MHCAYRADEPDEGRELMDASQQEDDHRKGHITPRRGVTRAKAEDGYEGAHSYHTAKASCRAVGCIASAAWVNEPYDGYHCDHAKEAGDDVPVLEPCVAP